MQFKNIVMFRFPAGFDLGDFEALLGECALKPVGSNEQMSVGFVPPMGAESTVLSHRQGQVLWITLGTEKRLLPAAAVNQALMKKVAEIEAKEGRRLGSKARRALKEEIVFDLLPKALVTASRIDALIDLDRGVLAVDTSSRKTGELVASELRHALGSFPAVPLNAEHAPRTVMTAWLRGDELPQPLSLGEECELRDGLDKGAVVKCQRQELQGDEVAKHLEAGKQAVRVALIMEQDLSFVVGEDLALRKLRVLDGAMAALEGQSREDLFAELDARFALMAGVFGRCFDRLEVAFVITREAPWASEARLAKAA